jgi:hypothetical protein
VKALSWYPLILQSVNLNDRFCDVPVKELMSQGSGVKDAKRVAPYSLCAEAHYLPRTQKPIEPAELGMASAAVLKCAYDRFARTGTCKETPNREQTVNKGEWQ